MAEDKERKFAQDFLEKWLRAEREEREEGSAEDALAKIDEALKSAPDDPVLWSRRGTILLDLERWEEALASFRRVEALDPDHPRLDLGLSFALTKLGRADEAAEAQRKALAAAAPELPVRTPAAPEEAEAALAGLAEDLRAAEAEEAAVKGLEELETLAEGPGLVDEEDFATALGRWEGEGYDVSPLREVMEKDPDRARTAFFQFEQNVQKVQVLRDTVNALDPNGLERDIERVRALFRAPYQIWRIEAEMATLMEKSDARDRARMPRVGPSPRPPPPAMPRAPGATNGRPTTAPGRVNGLVAPAGRVNGLVVPTGRVNGLINGLARARGGLTNGLTNGIGLTNGLASRRFAQEARLRRGRVLLIPIVATLLLSLTLLAPPEPPPIRGGVAVDGRFAEWQGVPGYTQPSVAGNLDVDLRGYKVLYREERLSVYANVTGTAFGDPQDLDVWYAFLDVDGNPATGYDEGRLGAEAMIELEGGNASVTTAKAWQFAGADRRDWSGWEGLGVGVLAASGGPEVEFQLDATDLAAALALPAFAPGAARIALFLEDQAGVSSGSNLVFGPVHGALEVRQDPAGDTIPAGPANFLTLTVRAVGADVNLSAITVARGSQTPLLTGFTPRLVPKDTSQTIPLQVDATGLAAETLLTADLVNVTADRPVTLLGTGARAYVGSAPADKRVDGVFVDWTTWTNDTDIVGVPDPNVDILAHAGEVQNGIAYGFVQVRGTALGGSHEPPVRVRPKPGPSGTPSPPGPPERRPGEDVIRVYYDSNATAGGLPVSGIVADAYAEFRGRHGRVRSGVSFVWQTAWVALGSVDAVSVGDSLELSVNISGLDLRGADYVVDARSWRGEVDRTDVFGVRGTRSGPAGTTFVGTHDATLPATADGWVRFGVGGEEVAWRLPDISFVDKLGAPGLSRPAPVAFVRDDFGGGFRPAYPDLRIDAVYRVDLDRLKETFILTTPISVAPDQDLVLTMRVSHDPGLMVQMTGTLQGDEWLVDGPLGFSDGRGLSVQFLAPWVEDATGARLGLSFSWSEGSLGIRVPGAWLATAAYPVFLDPTTTYSLENDDSGSNDPGEQLGWSSAIGDFNGDGYADVLVGAPSNNRGGNLHGYAYVFNGPFSADDSSPDWVKNGTTNGARFGYAVATGNFNNDNYWDAVVSRLSSSSFPGDTQIFYGAASGLSATADVTFSSPASPANFGHAIASGNVDSANYDDVLIGETGRDNDGGLPSQDGVVYVYLSPFSSTESTADITLYPSSNASGNFGRAIATGKIDSDNYADVVVGEPLYNTVDGRVQFFKGSRLTGSGGRSPDATLSSQAAGERFGMALAAGFLNGDSYADVAVGAPQKNSGAAGDGAVYLFLANSDGSGLTTSASPDVTIAKQTSGENFGTSVLVVDFDGDGSPGAFVGAPVADTGGTDRGATYWFDAPTVDQTVDETLNGNQDGERFGQSLGAGKFSSDTWTVVAIGAYLWNDGSEADSGRAVVAAVPEPATMLVAVIGGIGLASSLHRRRLVRKR